MTSTTCFIGPACRIPWSNRPRASQKWPEPSGLSLRSLPSCAIWDWRGSSGIELEPSRGAGAILSAGFELQSGGLAGVGGAERDRTAGLLVANEALSQLSYSPTRKDVLILPVFRAKRANSAAASTATCQSWFMLVRNSALLRTFSSRPMSNSMASTGESGFKTRRSTKMRCRSSLGMSSSSLRVPER